MAAPKFEGKSLTTLKVEKPKPNFTYDLSTKEKFSIIIDHSDEKDSFGDIWRNRIEWKLPVEVVADRQILQEHSGFFRRLLDNPCWVENCNGFIILKDASGVSMLMILFAMHHKTFSFYRRLEPEHVHCLAFVCDKYDIDFDVL